MFLLDVFRKQAKGRTPYEWFEQIILSIMVSIISLVIVYSLILTTITLVQDLVSGIGFMETGALKDTFGLVLTVIILVEFNHSIVLAIRQRSGAIQVRIVVLITIIVLARKLVLLDYAAASMETLLGLGALALSLGGLYWLISDGERRRAPDSIVQ
ncbi:MAG: phosphate-starvation-inducible PsiE family protein [Alphaproteobacteria bacterium]|nr:phosphate-starvation-inducible PsiE family protein [Alphaproteobacteria bacterium]